jgi:hypothetical protein
MADEKHTIRDVELSDEQWRSVEQVIRNAIKHGPKANDNTQRCTDTCETASKCCNECGVSGQTYN